MSTVGEKLTLSTPPTRFSGVFDTLYAIAALLFAWQALHWIAGAPPEDAALLRLGAKTRYRMPDATCSVELRDDRHCRATFVAPQWAPTPGQYLVLYSGEVCLGGGVIGVPSGADADAPSMAATAGD